MDQPGTLCPLAILFKDQGEMQAFLEKPKLRGFVVSRLT